MISFLQPLALLALTAAAIPALFHLLGRRLPPVVVFPAVRYLTATEREHSRHLKLRNLVLLALRTLAIVFLVMAAAKPVARVEAGASHPPTAVAVVLDNSLSSSVVVEGRPVLNALLESARTAVGQIAAGDRLWLMLADGVPRRTTRLEALSWLDSIAPVPIRLDLGSAIRIAARAVLDDPLPDKQVVVLSDLQRSALSGGPEVPVPVAVARAPRAPDNRWLESARSEPPVWSPDGTVVVALGGTGGPATTVRLTVEGRDLARTVASPGEQVALSGEMGALGWITAAVELDPDEFKADDRLYIPVFTAPAAAVTTTPGAGRFVADAMAVLRQGERVVTGPDVVLSDEPTSSTTVVFPPAEAALVGAVNRSLAALGSTARFGELLEGEWQLEGEIGTGATVLRRHRLTVGGEVFARVANEAWLARYGNVILVASRMEPSWSDLPVSARFVPFLDFLVNRVAAREAWMLSATAGETVDLPPGTVELIGQSGIVPVPSDLRQHAPLTSGAYFLRNATGDTIGALSVNHDVRESRLDPADGRELRALLGSNARLVESDRLGRELFAGLERADLTGLLLLASLLAVLMEFAVASSVRASRGAS